MDRSPAVAVAALLVALFAVLTALFAVFRPGVGTSDAREAEVRARVEMREQQLRLHMVLFQRYVEKLALARQAQNRPLAAFYAGDIERNAMRMVEGRYVYGPTNVDLSAIAAEVALPRAQALAAAAEGASDAAVDAAFARMIDGCNQCHRRAGVRWIAIQAPPAPGSYPSQAFESVP